MNENSPNPIGIKAGTLAAMAALKGSTLSKAYKIISKDTPISELDSVKLAKAISAMEGNKGSNPGNLRSADGTIKNTGSGMIGLIKQIERYQTGKSKSGILPTDNILQFTNKYAPSNDPYDLTKVNNPQIYADSIVSKYNRYMTTELKKGGKMRPKYEDGTEDPIFGNNKNTLNGAKNVGINVFDNALNTPTPGGSNNTDTPQFQINDNGDAVPPAEKIIPLSAFAEQFTGKYGQKNINFSEGYTSPNGKVMTSEEKQKMLDETSASNTEAANLFSKRKGDVELIAEAGITAINELFAKKDQAKQKRNSTRDAIIKESFSPTFNPYAEGTGSQAIMKNGGKIKGENGLKIIDGGKTEQISSTTEGSPMVEFKGNTHAQGGIGIEFGGKVAEVEHNEVGWIGNDGGLNVFGKMKIPGTNKTFKKAAKDIAKAELEVDKRKAYYSKILGEGEDHNPYNKSAISTAKVMFKSLGNQSKEISKDKEDLASYQSLLLDLSGKDDNIMAFGGKIPKGEDGLTVGPGDPIVKIPLKSDFTKNGRDLKKMKGVVLHKTASDTSAKNVISGWDSDNRSASADFIIDKDGTITQVGELTDTKWASGKRHINRDSFQIEIVGKSSDSSDMTEAQYQALGRLHKEVFSKYGITGNDYFGHTQVNSKKGFDFPTKDSVSTVLSRSGITNQYKPSNSLDTEPKLINPIPSKITTEEPKTTSVAKNNTDPVVGTTRKPGIRSGESVEDYKKRVVYNPNAVDYSGNKGAWTNNAVITENNISNVNTAFTPKYETITKIDGTKETPYGAAQYDAAPINDNVNIGSSERKRGVLSPLALEQIAPELLTLATNKRDPVYQPTYQPELKQTFDISYQLGRNENQSAFNQAAKSAEFTGNVDALSQLAANLYKANESYNMQEVQGNATQKLGVYGQNTDTINDAKLKNISLLEQQQNKIAASKFNTRKEDIGAFTSMAGKQLQNELENKTYNAYGNLFRHYGFDKNGNVTFQPDQVTRKFNAGEAQQFGFLAAQKGLSAVTNGANKTATTYDENGAVKKVTTIDADLEEFNTIWNSKNLDDAQKRTILKNKKNSIYESLGN